MAEWEARHDGLGMLRSPPPRQRQVLAWTMSDFTPSEIAEQLGMTPNAVSANLKKARRAAAAYREAGEGEQGTLIDRPNTMTRPPATGSTSTGARSWTTSAPFSTSKPACARFCSTPVT
ncbi:helix-turn-helix transcriptional regulator [Streptosporangium sp. V21-05]|uniref:helix-turn-helix transcriptional regulator n=1 Tax=Streptosporangium sp. V21-05 TaxID=3446115 RepID=UPI003F52C998